MSESFLYSAAVPSNIALVKYWGKRDAERQWPTNDSLSMTLSAARTITTAKLKTTGDDQLLQHAAGTPQPFSAAAKGLRHLAFLRHELGFHQPLCLTTRNTFPTGCGIASSASGLGALTLAAIAAWTGAASLTQLDSAGFSRERLAALARLGSGSACRSFFGGYVGWQAGEQAERQNVAPVFDAAHWPLTDLIVLVSRECKAVGSSTGHLTAASSPLFAPRLAGLPARLRRMQAALLARDLPVLGLEMENEALEMHAVMLSSSPSLNYLQPKTLALLAWLRTEREQRGLAAYFTIDAGPNPHVLCAPTDSAKVLAAIHNAFPDLEVLMDGTGEGPVLSRRPIP